MGHPSFVVERFERMWGCGPGGGSFALLRMTAETKSKSKQRQEQKANAGDSPLRIAMTFLFLGVKRYCVVLRIAI
jgi:hypothetical protein